MSQTAQTTLPLEYDSGTTARRRRMIFHVWALPLLLLPGAGGSLYWYGDEYGVMAGANLPGIMAVIRIPWLRSVNSPLPIGVIALVINLALMAAVGLLMDRLRVWRWVYVVFPAIVIGVVFALTRQYRPGREWEPDAVCLAWAWGAYGIGVLGVGVGMIAVVVRRVRAARCQL